MRWWEERAREPRAAAMAEGAEKEGAETPLCPSPSHPPLPLKTKGGHPLSLQPPPLASSRAALAAALSCNKHKVCYRTSLHIAPSI